MHNAMRIALGLLLAPALAGAQPVPGKLIPNDINLLIGGDVAQVRAAGPPEVIKLLLDGARAAAEKIGADPTTIGAFAIGVLVPPGGSHGGKVTAVMAADMTIDPQKLEKELDPPITSRSYQGIMIRDAKADSYAVLPANRLLVTEQLPIERIIDLNAGKGDSLVDKKAAALLKRVNATGGRGPALFGWLDLSNLKPALKSQGPELASLEEAAGSLGLGPNGADLKLIGRCTTTDAAQQAATASRNLIKELASNPQLQIFGLKPLLEGIRIETENALVLYTLHVSAAQYADLMTRLSGFVAASMQPQPPPAEPQDEMPVKPKKKPKKKATKPAG